MSTRRSIFFRVNRRRPDYRRHYAQLPACLPFTARIVQPRRAAHQAMLGKALAYGQLARSIMEQDLIGQPFDPACLEPVAQLLAALEVKEPGPGIEDRARAWCAQFKQLAVASGTHRRQVGQL